MQRPGRRNNSAALRQGPGSPSRDIHNNIFELFVEPNPSTNGRQNYLKHSSEIRRPPEARLQEGRPCTHTNPNCIPCPWNVVIKLLTKLSWVGAQSFHFAWQNNKAILFYFTQNSCLRFDLAPVHKSELSASMLLWARSLLFSLLDTSNNFSLPQVFFFLAVLGLCCCAWLLFSCQEQGLLSSCSAQASHWSSFSCCRARVLKCTGFS